MQTAILRARWSSLLGEDLTDTHRNPGDTVERRRLQLEGLASGPPQEAVPNHDDFALIEPLGEGGMGLVYRAREHRLRREVALKMLRPGSSAAAQELFLAEAVLSGNLDHPNIVPVHSLGTLANGDPFLTMKLVAGETWQDRLGTMAAKELPEQLEILLQVSNAVAFAHSRGIVHNDLKPANVMLGAYGEVLVVDWGLAVSCWEMAPAGFRHRSEIKAPCGTPHYMAPELAQGMGEEIGPWTDLYLLGGMLYRVLQGRAPHQQANYLDSVLSAAEGNYQPLSEQQPETLRRLVDHALEPDRSRRLAEVAQFQAGIRTYLAHRESLSITSAAHIKLAACRQPQPGSPAQETGLYEGLAEAVADFRTARRLWEQNPGAQRGESAARLALAELAVARADLGLAEAQVALLGAAGLGAAEQARLTALRDGIAALHARRRRNQGARRRLRVGLALASLLVVATVAFFALRERWQLREQVADRHLAIDSLRAEIARLNPDSLALGCARSLARLPSADTSAPAELSFAQRQAHSDAVLGLLACVSARERLQQLDAEPIGERQIPTLPADERAALQDFIDEQRQAALQLALRNGSFDLARLIVDGMGLSEAARALERARIDQARAATVNRRRAQTREAIADLKRGREREGRTEWAVSPADYVQRISSFRHVEIAQLLADELRPFTERAAQGGGAALWTQAERDLLELLLLTLGQLELPQVSLEALSSFLAVVADAELTVTCGRALCGAGSADAVPVLLAARARLGADSRVWQRIARDFGRLPRRPSPPQASAEACYLYGVELSLYGEARAAIEAFDRAVALDPELSDAWLARGVQYRQLGENERARADYGAVIALDSTNAAAWNNRSNLLKVSDPEQALADLDQALRYDPELREAWANRAQLRLKQGDPEGSLADARELIARFPDDAQGHAAAARALSQLGRADEALAACMRAHELDVQDVDNLELRAYLYGMRGSYQRALEDCNQALRLDPRRAGAFAVRSNCHNALGKHAAALADADRAIALMPSLASAWYYRAHARALLGQHREAIADYEGALERGCQIDDILIQIAVHWCELDEGDPALDALDRHIARYPDQAYGYLVRAEILGLLGRTEESLRDLDSAVARDPGEPSARLMRAQLLWGRGDLAAALADLEEVGLTDPSAPLMAAVLCIQWAERGPEAEAAARLEAALVWLERAEQAGLVDLARLTGQPELAPLHDEPRWQQLLERLSSAP